MQMRVSGLEAVWAVGDVASFPVKQGGLAAQQADVAARAIAASAGAQVPLQTYQPVLRAALITGGALDFLRARIEEEGAADTGAGQALWSPPTKLAGNYLGPLIARAAGMESPQQLVDVDPSDDPELEQAGQDRARELVLAAADADARLGHFETALRWLELIERLDLVLPTRIRRAPARVAARARPRGHPRPRRPTDRARIRQHRRRAERPAAACRVAARDRAPNRGGDARPPRRSRRRAGPSVVALAENQPMTLLDVPIAPQPFTRFRGVLDDAQYQALLDTIEQARRVIDARVVWNINSTARGGGVAELLQSLIAYGRGAGFDARWTVIAGEPEFFALTKRIHNRLHGVEGDGGPLGDHERALYERVCDDNARELRDCRARGRPGAAARPADSRPRSRSA